MGSLIQNIPVYKPVSQSQQIKKQAVPAQDNVQASVQSQVFKSPFADAPVYTYAPARPLSPAHTEPKGVKPQAAAGYLVKENIFQSMGSTVKSYADYMKYFYKAAFKGEGTDYSVGKINDLAIRTGSLGIAAVLATSKAFPFAKGMEFVGLATWFGSMALWPRVLGLPIKMKTGVDINQRYVDSYGRRKFVYEDNLYRPIDIYRHADVNGKPLSPEEYYSKYDHDFVYLEKKGDKLGVPKDIKNRNEAVMNKMGQVAVQGRTLSMLTAGVMTPVVSSLVADALQNPLKEQIEKFRYEKETKKLHNLDDTVSSLLKSKTTKLDDVMQKLDIQLSADVESQLQQLLPENGQLSQKEFDKLSTFLKDKFEGTGFYEAIEEAMVKNSSMTEPQVVLSSELQQKFRDISKEAVKEVYEQYKAAGQEHLIPSELADYKGISAEKMRELIEKTENTTNIGKEMNLTAHRSLSAKFKAFVIDDIKNLNAADADEFEVFQEMVEKLIETKKDKYIAEQRRYIIPKKNILDIIKFAETNNQLKQRLMRFEAVSIKNVSESVTANNWSAVPQKYLKVIGFNKGELALIASQDSSVASEVITKRLEQLVQDPEKYKKAVEEMTKYAKTAISKEEKAMVELIGTLDTPGTLSKIKDLMTAVANDGRNSFGGKMSQSVNRYYVGKISEVQRKIRNTNDSFIRPVKVLDLFKNIKASVSRIIAPSKSDYERIIAEDKASHRNAFYPFHNKSYDEACKSMEAYLKDIALDKNDINDWTTKFEHEIPDGKRGINQSFELLNRLANEIFGDLSVETVTAMNDKEFAAKCRSNNAIMRARFLKINNPLAEYMTENNPTFNILKDFCNKKKENYSLLMNMLEERKNELSLADIEFCKTKLKEIWTTINKGYVYEISDRELGEGLAAKLNFGTSNKAISEMSGKGVVDFIIGAAQEVRSRNKWTKLVYGLLAGTGVVSALSITIISPQLL